MSSDNYFTFKYNRDDYKWYLVHGFMSTLQDGWPSTIQDGQPGFDSYEEVRELYNSLDFDFMGGGYSEYGLIQEEDDLASVVTHEQAQQWARERIATLRHYLGEDFNAE